MSRIICGWELKKRNMALYYRTQGLILKKSDKGEADQIFSIYTNDFGKLHVLGKGIRKNASKLRGGADIFSLSDIEFIQGKTQKTMIEAVFINHYPNIRSNMARFKIAHQIADVLEGMILKEEKDEKVWQLTNEVFDKLNDWQIKNSKFEILCHYFFWNLAAILGYQPELTSQSLAGQQIDGDLAKILKLFFKKDWSILARLKIEPNHYLLLKNISEWYNKNTLTINYEK